MYEVVEDLIAPIKIKQKRYISEGSYLKQIKLIPLLSCEEEICLAKRIAVGDKEAQRKLEEANLRLVVNIARRYVGKGMLFEDLIQEGNLGLLNAAQNFDYTKKCKFSTYSSYWIVSAITKAIAEQTVDVKQPASIIIEKNKVRRAFRILEREFNRTPTSKEIAEETGLTIDKVKEMQELIRNEIALSFETPLQEDTNCTLCEIIPDNEEFMPDAIVERKLLKEKLMELMEDLTLRQRQDLILKYGLEDGKERTSSEIGKEIGIGRKRIWAIEKKALEKLRQHKKIKQLEDFI